MSEPHPTFVVMALVLLILCWMASWAWLRLAKYPTDKHRGLAAHTTAWVFGFAGIALAVWLLTLS